MIIFLIIISLMLNIFAFIAIIILYLRQNKLIKMDERQKNIIKEMEELMSTYLLEMKEENQYFINNIQKLKEEEKIAPTQFDQKVQEETTEKEMIHTQSRKGKDIEQPNLRKTVSIHAIKAYQKQLAPEHKNIHSHSEDNISSDKQHIIQENEEILDGSNQSLVKRVKNMEKQGNSIEEIAKKLNKGKTEIELLLKLQKNIQE